VATITTFTSDSDNKWFEIVESAFAFIATSDTVQLENPVSFNLPHCFVGIQQFDVLGDPVLAGAGTYAISIRTLNSEVFEPVPGSPIDGTAPMTLDFASNISTIRAVPTGITTVVSYKLFLSANGN